MMCYDKKLEASRSDFYSDLYRTRDVDCVITSGIYRFLKRCKEKNQYPVFKELSGNGVQGVIWEIRSIAAVEVEKMFKEREVDFSSLPPLPLDSPLVM